MAKRIGPRVTPIFLNTSQLAAAAIGGLKMFPLLVSRRIITPEGTSRITWEGDRWAFRNSEDKEIGTNPPSLIQCVYGEKGSRLHVLEDHRFYPSSKGNYCVSYVNMPEHTVYAMRSKVGKPVLCGTGEVPLKLEIKDGWRFPLIEARLMNPLISRYRYEIKDIFLTRLSEYVNLYSPMETPSEKEAFIAEWNEDHKSDRLHLNPWVWAIEVERLTFLHGPDTEIMRVS